MKGMTLEIAGIVLLEAVLATALSAQAVVELPRRDADADVSVTPAYAIGGFEADGWQLFGSVSQVEFDGAGNLYLLDRQSMEISIVAPDGSLVHQFGTQGDGPGEFRQPGAMGVTRDGRVFVQDAGHRAYLEFDAEGEFVQQVPMVVEGGTLIMSSLQTDPTGPRFFTSSAGGGSFMSISRESEGADDVDIGMPTGRPIERVAIGDAVETSDFFSAWDPPEPQGEGGEVRAGGAIRVSMPQQVIWEPRLFFAPLPDGGLAVVDSSAFAVKIVDGSGRHVRTITRPSVEPRRVTDRIRNREIERRADLIQSGGGPQMRIVTNDGGGNREMPQEQIRQMQIDRLEGTPFWPEIPAIGAMTVGWDGLIWLERAEVDPTEDGPIDLFRADGSYVGTLPADGEMRIPSAFGPGGLAAWIEEDEFEVATVRVGRLGAGLR
jgi:hypothetical protein